MKLLYKLEGLKIEKKKKQFYLQNPVAQSMYISWCQIRKTVSSFGHIRNQIFYIDRENNFNHPLQQC